MKSIFTNIILYSSVNYSGYKNFNKNCLLKRFYVFDLMHAKWAINKWCKFISEETVQVACFNELLSIIQ